jgi:hypothetical protein
MQGLPELCISNGVYSGHRPTSHNFYPIEYNPNVSISPPLPKVYIVYITIFCELYPL